jgi:hypothetical protein
MGIIVDTNEVKDLAEAMRKIMNQETYISKEKLVERAEEFDATRQTKHWEKMMEERYLVDKVQKI